MAEKKVEALGAIVALNSDLIAKINAGKSVPAALLKHYPRRQTAQVTITNGDSSGSVYHVCRVNSNHYISTLRITNPAIAGATANVGIYKAAANGSAVLDALLFGSTNLASLQVSVDIATAAGTKMQNTQKPLWQLLGMDSDPNIPLDICITLTAAATATGVVQLQVDFGI